MPTFPLALAANERALCSAKSAFTRSGVVATPVRSSRWCLQQRTKQPQMDSRSLRQNAVGIDTDGDGAGLISRLGAVKTVYLDFDDTITEGLSTNVQIKAVIESIAKRMESAEEAGKFVQERKALIARLAVEYEESVKEHLRSLFMKFPKGEFSMDAINEAMDISDEFDKKWAQISSDNKVFAGVRKDDFLSMAPLTPLRENALETIRALRESGIDIAIVSINWSSEWIQKVLGDMSSVASNGSVIPEGNVKIYSNEMLYQDGVATGKLETIMRSGREKASVVQQLMQESVASNGTSPGISVFVGDSFNDIQPLLMADVGIVMGQNAGLMSFAKHFGIELKPLNEAMESSRTTSSTPVLFMTDSWVEVTEAILGKEKAAQMLSLAAT